MRAQLGVNPGDYRHRVVLQSATITRGADGSERHTWIDTATVWAEILTGGGREFAAAKSVNPEITHQVELLYRASVKANMRIKYSDPKDGSARYFDIRAVVNPDEQRIILRLHCRELTDRATES